MQVAFVGELDADFADVVGALVVGGFVPGVDALDILVVDATDVAGHVRGDLAERILAEQARFDLNTRKTVAIDRKSRDLFVR